MYRCVPEMTCIYVHVCVSVCVCVWEEAWREIRQIASEGARRPRCESRLEECDWAPSRGVVCVCDVCASVCVCMRVGGSATPGADRERSKASEVGSSRRRCKR